MSIIKALENLKVIKVKRGWDRTFWAIDIHGTLIKPNYTADEIPTDTYEHAIDCLKILSDDPSVCLILYTCSHNHEILEYLEFFKSKGVNFEYINENPEVKTDLGGYGCYDKKPYFNILFEDKAGFDAETDWLRVKGWLLHEIEAEKVTPKKIVVFTGAGISAESGIPTFRDRATGIWENHNPEEVASLESWNRDPQMVCDFHNDIRGTIKDKIPNKAHKYFAELEKDHDVTIITQNIDDLHEKAGSSKIYHIHGEINKAKCEGSDEIYVVDDKEVMFGKESMNGFIFKPNTVLFGEYPQNVDESVKALSEADILIIVGTSFEISYVLPFLVDSLPRTSKVIYIDKAPAYNLFGHFKDLTVLTKSATDGVDSLEIFIKNP